MDAQHSRLLVTRFAEMFGFYQAVLPEMLGAKLMKGGPEGPYANWDVEDESVLILFDRAMMARLVGTSDLPVDAAPAQDHTMFVCRVGNVDAGTALCVRNGATLVVAPTERPEWGPTLRTAHLRDPEGNLIELQSYEG